MELIPELPGALYYSPDSGIVECLLSFPHSYLWFEQQDGVLLLIHFPGLLLPAMRLNKKGYLDLVFLSF